MRVIGFLIGIALVASSAFVPTASRPEGGRSLESFAVMALGAIMMITSLLHIRGHRTRSFWTAVFLFGFAARLALTQPLWLQYLEVRFHEWNDAIGRIAVLVLLAECALVAADAKARAILRRISWRHAAFAVLYAGATGFHWSLLWPHREDAGWWRWSAMQIGATIVLSAVELLVLWLRSESSGMERGAAIAPADATPAAATTRASRLERLAPWLAALFVTGTSAALARGVMAGVPYIPDALAYLFQARCYASGHWSIPAPPVPEAMKIYLVTVENGRMFGVVHPGWPLVLSLGVLVGAPWIVNPLLGGATILLLHALTLRLADRRTALIVTLLASASPWFLWLSASHMTHSLSLFLLVAGWLLVVRARSDRSWLAAAIGGLAFGYHCAVRPLDGIVTGALTGLWLLVRRAPARIISAFAAGCVVGTAPLLLFNHHFTGSVARFPLNSYIDALWYPGANDMGFGPSIGNPPNKWGLLDPLPGHSWPDVLFNTNQNLYNLDFELSGWLFGSILIVLFGWFTPRREHDRPMTIFLVVLFLLYNLYWFSGGPDFGARYWYLMFPPIIWFGARGIARLEEWLAAHTIGDARARVRSALLLLTLAVLGIFMPWRAIAKYDRYRGFHSDWTDIATSSMVPPRALIFVTAPNDVDYGCAFILNPLDSNCDAPIFVRDVDPATNMKTAAAYPGRAVLRAEGPSANGARARLIDTSGMGMGSDMPR